MSEWQIIGLIFLGLAIHWHGYRFGQDSMKPYLQILIDEIRELRGLEKFREGVYDRDTE